MEKVCACSFGCVGKSPQKDPHFLPPPQQIDLCSILTTIACAVCLAVYKILLHEMLSRLDMSKAEMSKVENEQLLFVNFN